MRRALLRDKDVTALALVAFFVKVQRAETLNPIAGVATDLRWFDMESALLPDEGRSDLLDAEPAKGRAPGANRVDDLDDGDFAVVLLQALTRMAVRSKRRQADLTAALRGADIQAEPARVRSALKILRAQGAIENLVPLSDGGLLLSVTQKGSSRAAPAPEWLPLEDLDTAG